LDNKLVIKEKLDIIPKSIDNIVNLSMLFIEEYQNKRVHIINAIRKVPAVVNSMNQVKAGELYKAVVPPGSLPKIKDRSIKLKQMSNGLCCPTLADAKTGRFVCHVQLQKVNPKVLELSSQMALQNAIADITYQLEEINGKLDKILVGQQNDRLAMVDSCEQQYIEAMNVEDEIFKKYMLANVIKTGNDARAQLLKNFRDDIKFIEQLPNKDEKLKINIKNFTDGNFNANIQQKMSSLYEAYRAIGRSSMILMFVYQELGQQKNIALTLKPLQIMLNEISNNNLLKNKLYDYDIWDKKKEIESIWYKEPLKAIKSINDTVNKVKNINEITWEIEIKGEELLERDV